MSADKELRRSLKSPDYFQRSFVYGLKWLEANSVLVGSVVGLSLVSLLAVAGWQYYSSSKLSARQDELAAIEYKYQKAQQDADKKKSEIQKQIDALPKKPDSKPKDGEEAAEVLDPAKKSQLESEMNAIKPQIADLVPAYLAFDAKFPKTPESWLSSLRAASIQLSDKKIDEAKTILERVAQESSQAKNKFYSGYAQYLLVNVLVEQKNFEEAIKLCDALSKNVPKDMMAQVLMLKAKTYAAKSDKDNSIKVLDQIIKDFPAAPEAQKAKSMKPLLVNG